LRYTAPVRLASATLVHLPPFDEITVPFSDEDGPLPFTVLLGGGGVGKTTFLTAVASTRPGHCTALTSRASDEPPHALCEWLLGRDDPERPHTLAVATPTARVYPDDQTELLRRREQALFEKVAREGGFAFLAIPSTRWFSRQPIALSAPARTIARYDVRAPVVTEDASRSDLARETKQALAYAAIADALGERRPVPIDLSLLGEAMLHAVNTLIGLAGFRYDGLDPVSFEPTFSSDGSHMMTFDALPTRARHLVALAALPIRTLWAAYPGQDPRESEGVVMVDEVELHQDLSVHGQLIETLHRAIPGVQWICTATSPLVTAGLGEREVFVLRRMPDQKRVELFSGADSRLH
jgi:hypothetical protein